MISNGRNKDGGGVLIAVLDVFAKITVEVSRTKEVYESLWVVINNGKVNVKIGVVYLPQEKPLSDKELTDVYNLISTEIRKGKEKDQSIIVAGDFNCRVGEAKVKGTLESESKGGKKLLAMIEKEKMILTNASDKCNGLWTREERGKRSVIDFIIMEEDDEHYIKSIEIDENKSKAPFRLKNIEGGSIQTVYSDHNPMILKTNLILKEQEKYKSRIKRIITEDGYKKYCEELEKEKVADIWNKTASLQEKYDEWSQKVMDIRKKHEELRKPKRKQRSKTMRLLLAKKKQLNELKNNAQSKETKDEIHKEMMALKEMIILEEKDHKYRRLMKTTESLCKNGKFDSGSFWELQKREKSCNDNAHAVRNSEGVKVDTTEEILKAYQDFYGDLLTVTNKKVAEKAEEPHVEKIKMEFSSIMEKGSKQGAKQISSEIISKATKRLKRKKARDREEWNNEMVLEGGKEMEESLKKMFTEILNKEEIPTQWIRMLIISIHKKGLKELLENKRGLFLTNILSKLFEKVMEDLIGVVKYDRAQFGGTKGRGPIDNWFILMAVRDEGKRLKKNIYMFFGDLVKCFDRLWLKDCLIDLRNAGAREREIRMLYKLNEEAGFKVKTPAGTTKTDISVKEIVKQGSVFGTKLCCASTGTINNEDVKNTVIYPTVQVKAPTFVDDLGSFGDRQVVKSVMERCPIMEREKFWEFSIEKSKWLCIQNNKAEEVEEMEVAVNQGLIGRALEYKYLGNWVNNKGNLDTHLTHMEKNAKTIIRLGNIMCSQEKVGKMEIACKLFIYDKIAVLSVFYNIEVWSNLRQQDMNKLETIQGMILKGLIGLPKSTPYWGILYELNILPIHLRMTYKKLMVYHQLMNSNDDRIAKQIVQEQEHSGLDDCWFSNVKQEAEAIGLVVKRSRVIDVKKSKWKRTVKTKIQEAFQNECRAKIGNMTKLRFLSKCSATDSYLKYLSNNDVRDALKIRLNMVDAVAENFGIRKNCALCGMNDNTEHVFECSALGDHGLTIENLMAGTNMLEVVELFRKMENLRKDVWIDEIITNFNVFQREDMLLRPN